MKRLTATIALVAVLGFMAGAFACNNCAPANLSQHINVTVPTVVSLILDGNVSNSAQSGQTKWLANWDINLTQPANYKAANCYVVPNWVGYEGAGGMSLQDFIAYVGGASNLFPAWNSYVHGSYPAVISANNQVLTWGQVAAKWPAFAKYARLHPNARAKGNIVCMNQIAVEKYTNCETMQFGVAVTSANGDTVDNFGKLLIQDAYQFNGLPGTAGLSPWRIFTSASGTVNYQLLVPTIPTGTFVDDVITQMMWLRNSQPGEHDLITTYTLGSALVGPV